MFRKIGFIDLFGKHESYMVMLKIITYNLVANKEFEKQTCKCSIDGLS